MSVINQMLRDLDAQGRDPHRDANAPLLNALGAGLPPPRRRRLGVTAVVVLGLLLSTAAAIWLWSPWNATEQDIRAPSAAVADLPMPPGLPATDTDTDLALDTETADSAPASADSVGSPLAENPPSMAHPDVAMAPTTPAPKAETAAVPATETRDLAPAVPLQSPTPLPVPAAAVVAERPPQPDAAADPAMALPAAAPAPSAAEGPTAGIQRADRGPADTRQAQLDDARRALANGDYAQAAAVFEQRLATDPADTVAAAERARIALLRGESAALALAWLEPARRMAPQDAHLAALWAAAAQRSGRHAEAVRAYRQALTRQPAQAEWWTGLAISLQATAQADEAKHAYAEALRLGSLPPPLQAYARSQWQVLSAPPPASGSRR